MIGLLKKTHRKVPKITTLATFGFSSLFLSLLPGSLNLYRTWAVRSYDNNIATIVRTSTLFIWRNLFLCYCFLNKYSKELFDYGVDIHRRKEDFLNIKKMYCPVRFELHKGMSKIIIPVSFLKLVVTALWFSLFLARREITFEVATFWGSLLLALPMKFYPLLLGGRYFGNLTVVDLPVKLKGN